MGVATEIYAELEQDLLRAIDAGKTPTGWLLTSELYRQLGYGGDHFTTADRAIHYGEPPKPLYQLPVRLEYGAHCRWTLRTGADHG